MREILRTFIRGEPQPMPRPRFGAMPNGKGGYRGHAYQPEKYGREDQLRKGQWLPWVVWKQQIKRHVSSIMRMPSEPADGPILLRLEFFMPRPEYMLKPSAPQGRVMHTAKPDADNLAKLVMDAMSTVWTIGDA